MKELKEQELEQRRQLGKPELIELGGRWGCLILELYFFFFRVHAWCRRSSTQAGVGFLAKFQVRDEVVNKFYVGMIGRKNAIGAILF